MVEALLLFPRHISIRDDDSVSAPSSVFVRLATVSLSLSLYIGGWPADRPTIPHCSGEIITNLKKEEKSTHFDIRCIFFANSYAKNESSSCFCLLFFEEGETYPPKVKPTSFGSSCEAFSLLFFPISSLFQVV